MVEVHILSKAELALQVCSQPRNCWLSEDPGWQERHQEAESNGITVALSKALREGMAVGL